MALKETIEKAGYSLYFDSAELKKVAPEKNKHFNTFGVLKYSGSKCEKILLRTLKEKFPEYEFIISDDFHKIYGWGVTKLGYIGYYKPHPTDKFKPMITTLNQRYQELSEEDLLTIEKIVRKLK